MPRTAVIAGASGLIGGYCLQELLEDPAFDPVIALVRKPLPVEHRKLRQVTADFEELSELHPMTGGAVFCALGTTIRKAGSQEAFRKVDYSYTLAVAKMGLAAGASSLAVVSSIGADPASSTFYLRVKGEMEEAVKRLGYESLHLLQPSFLLGSREEDRPGERIAIAAAKALQFAFVGSLRQYHPIEGRIVARAMIKAASEAKAGVLVSRYDEITKLGT